MRYAALQKDVPRRSANGFANTRPSDYILCSTVAMAFHGPAWGQLQTCADRVRSAAGQFWTTLICL